LIQAAETERAPWPDRLKRIEALASSTPKPSRWHPFYAPSKLFFESEVSSVRLLAITVASTRAARVAVAVEQYSEASRRRPQRIDDLVPQYLDRVPADPFDGAPIRYSLEPDGYAVYSVGQDGRDDGGDFSKRWINLPDGRPMQVTADVGMRVRIR